MGGACGGAVARNHKVAQSKAVGSKQADSRSVS